MVSLQFYFVMENFSWYEFLYLLLEMSIIYLLFVLQQRLLYSLLFVIDVQYFISIESTTDAKRKTAYFKGWRINLNSWNSRSFIIDYNVLHNYLHVYHWVLFYALWYGMFDGFGINISTWYERFGIHLILSHFEYYIYSYF